VEEQRMYEIAKLKGQFKDILLDNGLLASRADEDDDESGSDPRGFGQVPHTHTPHTRTTHTRTPHTMVLH
jgi:hypothetical protein